MLSKALYFDIMPQLPKEEGAEAFTSSTLLLSYGNGKGSSVKSLLAVAVPILLTTFN
jgi:hypothetical protein